jgi:hypothetical protein
MDPSGFPAQFSPVRLALAYMLSHACLRIGHGKGFGINIQDMGRNIHTVTNTRNHHRDVICDMHSETAPKQAVSNTCMAREYDRCSQTHMHSTPTQGCALRLFWIVVRAF